MKHAVTIALAVLLGLGALALAAPDDGPVTITFDQVETGKPMANYTEQGVAFALSRQPTKNRAAGKVMFFPHLKTKRNGIVNAMANESIPVEVRFPKPASSVTLVLWGSVGSEALVEAFDKDGKVVDKAFQATRFRSGASRSSCGAEFRADGEGVSDRLCPLFRRVARLLDVVGRGALHAGRRGEMIQPERRSL